MSIETEILDIVVRTILISGASTFLAVLWGLPTGIIIGLRRFRSRSLVKGFFNAMTGMPTVSLGLILYMILSRAGPLGFLHILYTPLAIILGQAVLITPLTISFITSTIESVDPEIRTLAKTLGASETQASMAVLRESISGVFLAIISSFNRAISELGIALMLGGNIRGLTRVLTTSIALETTRGELVLGMALTIILLSIVFTLNTLINITQKRGKGPK